MGAMSPWVAGQWWPCHCGGYITVASRSVVAMSLLGLQQSGLRFSGGHVIMGAMSQLAAGQWWPCHCEVMSECEASQWWPCHCGGYITVGSMATSDLLSTVT